MFKKYFELIIILIPLLTFGQTKSNYKFSNNFSFKIIATTYKYDSKTGVYTRQYIEKDSSVVTKLDKKELELIQKLINNLNFKKFPENFECSILNSYMMPSFETTIEVKIEGKIKKSTNTTYCEFKTKPKMAKSFELIRKEIYRILNSKKEINQMRECDLIFE